MTIEQRLAELIQASCADALSPAVNLNVDLDVVLCVLAQALLAASRLRLPATTPTPHPTPSSDPFSTPRRDATSDGITVKINRRRRHHPGLRRVGYSLADVTALIAAAAAAVAVRAGRP